MRKDILSNDIKLLLVDPKARESQLSLILTNLVDYVEINEIHRNAPLTKKKSETYLVVTI